MQLKTIIEDMIGNSNILQTWMISNGLYNITLKWSPWNLDLYISVNFFKSDSFKIINMSNVPLNPPTPTHKSFLPIS